MISSTLRRTAAVAALATIAATLVGAGTATATDPTATSLSIRAVKTAVAPGASTAIIGHLNVAAGLSNAGKPVALEAKAAGEDTFIPIGVAVTGPRGGVRLAVTPASTTRYRWDFAGDAQNRASRSGIVTVRVRTPDDASAKLMTSLSIRASRARVGLDGTAVVSGRLRSHNTPLARKWVLLLAKKDGATKWTFGGAKRTKALGQVAFTVRPLVGTRYRLAFLGSVRFRAVRSGIVHVAARPTALTVTASPRLIDPGASSTVTGILTNAGTPYAGQTVQLRSKVVGSGVPFATEASGTTAADGSVAFTVAPAKATRYLLFFPSTTQAPAARSAIVTVSPKWATSLSIRSRATAEGYAVSGQLRGHGTVLPHRPVTLQRLLASETTWSDVDTLLTGRRGRVGFRQESAPGTSYRLVFAGGARFAPSTSGVVTH